MFLFCLYVFVVPVVWCFSVFGFLSFVSGFFVGFFRFFFFFFGFWVIRSFVSGLYFGSFWFFVLVLFGRFGFVSSPRFSYVLLVILLIGESSINVST